MTCIFTTSSSIGPDFHDTLIPITMTQFSATTTGEEVVNAFKDHVKGKTCMFARLHPNTDAETGES